MKKSSKILLSSLLFLSTSAPVFAQTATTPENYPDIQALLSEAKDSEMTAPEYLVKVGEANQSMMSTKLDTSLFVEAKDQSNDDKSLLTSEAKIAYQNEKEIQAFHCLVKTENKDGGQYIESYMPADEPGQFYMRENETDEFTPNTIDVSTLTLQPEYFSLIDNILKIGSDLEVKETDNEVILTLANPDAKLIDAFQEEFDMSFNGVENAELTQSATFVFDKETNYLKAVDIDILFENPDNSVQMIIKTGAAQWNEIPAEEIGQQQ